MEEEERGVSSCEKPLLGDNVLKKAAPKLALPEMALSHQQGCSCCCYSNPGYNPLSLWAVPLQERSPGTHESDICEIGEERIPG